jgi:predicted RNase H-related nuclease YkuK (DUF458 family)
MKFKDYNGKPIELNEIVLLINPNENYNIYIGTDSQIHSQKKVIYATCIVLHKKGKGGRIFISKKKTKPPNSLGERLMQETWRSLKTAFSLLDLVPKNIEIIIHLDVNPDGRHPSGEFCQRLVGMVTGQGFKCFVKPDASVAQTVADKFSK